MLRCRQYQIPHVRIKIIQAITTSGLARLFSQIVSIYSLLSLSSPPPLLDSHNKRIGSSTQLWSSWTRKQYEEEMPTFYQLLQLRDPPSITFWWNQGGHCLLMHDERQPAILIESCHGSHRTLTCCKITYPTSTNEKAFFSITSTPSLGTNSKCFLLLRASMNQWSIAYKGMIRLQHELRKFFPNVLM